MENHKELQQSLNKERKKAQKGSKNIQVLQKYLKLVKEARKSAENSIWLHSDTFRINTGKLQGVNIDSGGSSLNKFKLSIIQHENKN